MNSSKSDQNWYPIEQLPMFTKMIEDSIIDTEENYATFLEAKSKPHVLDDLLIDRAIKNYTEQITYINCCDKQLERWKKDTLTKNQIEKINELITKNIHNRKINQNILSLLSELKKGNINRIMEMDDYELGLNVLLGKVKPL